MTIELHAEQTLETILWNEVDVQAKVEKFHATVDYDQIAVMVANYVDEYIEEHGIETGATPEQVEQMNSNTARLDVIEAGYVQSVGEMTGQVPVATDDDIELILNGGYRNA